MTKEERLLAIKAWLRATAVRRWPDDKEHQDRYVWGTINKLKEKMRGTKEVPSGGLVKT